MDSADCSREERDRIDIVLADDDESFCRVTRDVLQRHGYEVVVAHDGNLALDAVRNFRPRLVLLDSMLPAKPGLACLRAIRAAPNLRDVRVVMCSAKGDLDYVLECGEAGAEGFIHKPFEIETFVSRIRHVLET